MKRNPFELSGEYMPTWEVTLAGFDPEDASTDDLVLWLKAPTKQALDAFLGLANLSLHEQPRHMEGRDDQIAPEECDMVLDGAGLVIWHPTKDGEQIDDFRKLPLVEVNANSFWADVNARFCKEHCRATGSEGSLFLMDGTNCVEKLEDAKEFGCTEEFIAAYQLALDMGAEFVLFTHDV